jgi:hypothetical protein
VLYKPSYFGEKKMKLNRFLMLLAAVICSLAYPLAATTVLDECINTPAEAKVHTHKDSAVPICPKDIGRHGLVVARPGEYYLTGNISYDPKGTNPAIRISSRAKGNVTIDLNGFTLSQRSKKVLNINGIVVDPGLDNILIKNGTVENFSNAGISVGAPQAAVVSNLKISNINALNNAISSQDVAYINVPGGGGMIIATAQDIIIENSSFNGNAFGGMFVLDFDKLTVTNSHFDDNTWANNQVGSSSADPTINVAVALPCGLYAFYYPSVNDIVFSNCTFDRNTSIGAIDVLEIVGGNNVSIDSCTFNDNSCIVSDQVVSDTFGGSFSLSTVYLDGSNITVDNCQVNSNLMTINIPITSFTSSYLQGIVMQYASNISITNCEVSNQVFTNNSGAGGFRVLNQAYTSYIYDQIYCSNSRAYGVVNIDDSVIVTTTVTAPSLGAVAPVSGGTITVTSTAGFPTSGQIVVATTTGNQLLTYLGTTPTSFTGVSGGDGVGTMTGSVTTVPFSGTAEGWDLSAGNNFVIEDCFAAGQSQAVASPGFPGAEFSYATGFSAHYYANNVVFRRCIAMDNQDTGTLGGEASGFTTREPNTPGGITGQNYIFDSCIAEDNTDGAGTGAGFDLLNLINSKVVGCKAEGNNIGISVADFGIATTIAAGSNGLALPQSTINVASTAGFSIDPITGVGTIVVTTSAGPQTVTYTGLTATSFTGVLGGTGTMSTGGAVTFAGHSMDLIVCDNILEANTNYGILDSSAAADSITNAYYRNVAKKNGATPAGTPDTNYHSTVAGGVFTVNGAPIRLWLLPAAPNATNNQGTTVQPLDNYSIK